MKSLFTAPLLLLAVCGGAAAANAAAAAPATNLPDGLYAEIQTPRGVVTCELFAAKTPLTVASFVGLAEGTLGPAPRKPYFDGITFHRVVPDFVIQGGDPTGTGKGGPGYTFPDEFVAGLRHDDAGVLSMANLGPDTNGSQFFITLRETNRLNYLHSVFGRVVRGLDVLPRVEPGDAMNVRILRVGPAAKAFRADEGALAELLARAKPYSALSSAKAEPGPDAHFDDPGNLLPTEPARARHFNFKLANQERTTGVRIMARVLAGLPAGTAKENAGAFMKDLATRLGVAERGALAAYFASEDTWRVWIGDEHVARFVGRAGTARQHVDSGALHESKQAFLKTARAAGDADYAHQQRTLPPDRQPPPAQRTKLQTDAVLDGLIFRLESK